MPNFRCRLSKRPGMFFAQGDTGICVVVEHGEFGSPGHPHREARGDEDADRGLETVGPGGDVAQRSRGPVVGTDQLAHGRGLHRARLAVGLGCAFLHRIVFGFHMPRNTTSESSSGKGKSAAITLILEHRISHLDALVSLFVAYTFRFGRDRLPHRSRLRIGVRRVAAQAHASVFSAHVLWITFRHLRLRIILKRLRPPTCVPRGISQCSGIRGARVRLPAHNRKTSRFCWISGRSGATGAT